MRQVTRSICGLWPALVLCVLPPVSAHAHGTIQGMDEIIGGAIHPLMTPLHVLILLGLGLWLGQQSPLRLQTPAIIFLSCSAAGLLATLTGKIAVVPPPIVICVALCAGALVAFAVRLPSWASGALLGFAALAISPDSTVDNATSAVAIAKTLVGTWLSLTVWLVTIAFYVSLCPPRQWVQIGIRVAGSWMVAISLLILAFSLRK